MCGYVTIFFQTPVRQQATGTPKWIVLVHDVGNPMVSIRIYMALGGIALRIQLATRQQTDIGTSEELEHKQ